MRAKVQATLLGMALLMVVCIAMYTLFYFVPGAYENFQMASGMSGELWEPREYVIRLVLIMAAVLFPMYGFVSMVIDIQHEGE